MQECNTILIWLASGTLRLASPGGSPVVIDVAPGQIRYERRGTVEAEEVLSGSPRAMVFAFK